MNSSVCLQFDPVAGMLAGTDRAYTSEGTNLTAWVLDALEELWTSETVGGSLKAHRLALDEAVHECDVENWDGYGAAPANPLSVHWAGLLLEALPRSAAAPDVAFDPVGNAVLEWSPSRGRVLSINVGRAGELRFAMRTPTSKLTGIETLTDGLPGGLAQAFAALDR